MTNQKINKRIELSGREKAVLIISSLIMVGTIPLTYIFFLLPLLNLPIVALAVLVLTGVIRNRVAVRIIQFLTVIGAVLACWPTMILLDWMSK